MNLMVCMKLASHMHVASWVKDKHKQFSMAGQVRFEGQRDSRINLAVHNSPSYYRVGACRSIHMLWLHADLQPVGILQHSTAFLSSALRSDLPQSLSVSPHPIYTYLAWSRCQFLKEGTTVAGEGVSKGLPKPEVEVDERQPAKIWGEHGMLCAPQNFPEITAPLLHRGVQYPGPSDHVGGRWRCYYSSYSVALLSMWHPGNIPPAPPL